ncbi:MAG: tetratricopeptide repeat protein [bacterium]|nr:tetratricopeptide repeat protein [bacterium]
MVELREVNTKKSLSKREQSRLISFPVLALSLSIIGCAGGQQVRPESEIAISELRRIQADQTTIIASIRNDIRDMVGRIDEIEHKNTELRDINKNLKTIESRLPPPEGVPVMELISEERALEKVENSTFKEALSKLRAAKFSEAIELLQTTINSEGNTANHLYWLGIANENYGFLEKALGSYHECSKQFPQNTLAPACLIRQADVFIKLGDKDSAKLTLQKAISSYGSSSYASTAKSKLKLL